MSEKSNRGSYVPNPKYEDAFFVNRENETVKWMYYNPDSAAGGQYVTNVVTYEDIRDAAKEKCDAQGFFDFLGMCPRQTLADIGSEWFDDAKAEYNETPDLTDCTEETMQALKKLAAPGIDWIIHLVSNITCDTCGKAEEGFLPFACNAHTHGMERYNHPDFQVVLRMPDEEIGWVLNSMGRRVQAGETFKAGDLVSGVFEDCPVRLDEVEETGRKVLRVVIPDGKNRFPEDPACEGPYNLQTLPTEALYCEGGAVS